MKDWSKWLKDMNDINYGLEKIVYDPGVPYAISYSSSTHIQITNVFERSY